MGEDGEKVKRREAVAGNGIKRRCYVSESRAVKWGETEVCATVCARRERERKRERVKLYAETDGTHASVVLKGGEEWLERRSVAQTVASLLKRKRQECETMHGGGQNKLFSPIMSLFNTVDSLQTLWLELLWSKVGIQNSSNHFASNASDRPLKILLKPSWFCYVLMSKVCQPLQSIPRKDRVG